MNDLIKRARLAKVLFINNQSSNRKLFIKAHALIISRLKAEMPSMFGKDAKKKELIKNLESM